MTFKPKKVSHRVGLFTIAAALVGATASVSLADTTDPLPKPMPRFTSEPIDGTSSDNSAPVRPNLHVGQEIAAGQMKQINGRSVCDFKQSGTRVRIEVPKGLQGAEVVWTITPTCKAIIKELIVHPVGDLFGLTSPIGGHSEKAQVRGR